MSTRIDAYGHALPTTVRDTALEFGVDATLTDLPAAFWDAEIRLADMDEYDIDKQVLTLSHPPIWRGLSISEALELTRVANDGIHNLAETAPDRFIPFATLPRLDGLFLDELDRCLSELGSVGVQIFSTAGGKPLDHEDHDSFWRQVSQTEIPVWIHPQLHEWHDWMEGFESKALGWPFDTSVAMLRLVRRGLFERYPDLDVLAHHMGAMVPHFSARIREFITMGGDDPEPIIRQLQQFHVDTVLNGSVSALECGRSFYSSDNILFATDYPFGPDAGRRRMNEIGNSVSALDIDDDTRSAIFADNAASLLG